MTASRTGAHRRKKLTHALAYLKARLGQMVALRLEGLLAAHSLVKLLNFLRRRCPILAFRQVALVTTYADVRQVLLDGEHFSSDYPKAGPAQIVAMRDTPDYRHFHRLMESASTSSLTAALPMLVRGYADQLLADARGRLDAVSEFAQPITLMLADKFFGVSAPTVDLRRWTRAIFRDVFTNFTNNQLITAAADQARSEFNQLVDNQIAAIHTESNRAASPRETMLATMVMAVAEGRKLNSNASVRSLPDQTLRDLIVGLICGASDTLSNAFARILDYLLDHARDLEGARLAARAQQFELLCGYAYEALRFSPETVLLPRRCVKNVILAPLTRRARLVMEQTGVIAAIAAAMFDPAEFPEPEIFRADRPINKYLHFGAGLHRCFGEPIARIVLPAALAAILSQPELRRAPGRAGRLRWDGAFPTHMIVSLGG